MNTNKLSQGKFRNLLEFLIYVQEFNPSPIAHTNAENERAGSFCDIM